MADLHIAGSRLRKTPAFSEPTDVARLHILCHWAFSSHCPSRFDDVCQATLISSRHLTNSRISPQANVAHVFPSNSKMQLILSSYGARPCVSLWVRSSSARENAIAYSGEEPPESWQSSWNHCLSISLGPSESVRGRLSFSSTSAARATVSASVSCLTLSCSKFDDAALKPCTGSRSSSKYDSCKY